MTDKERFKPGDKIRLINDDGTGIQTIKKVIRDGYLTTEMLRIKLKDENQWVRVDDNFESELEKQWGKYNHVDWGRMQRIATLTKGDFYRIARYFMEWGKKCNETTTKDLKEEMERFFNTDEYIAGEIGVYDIASHFANWQLKLSNVERIGKNWKEEPVSEDLDEAAKIYARGEYDRKNPSSLPWQCKGCYSPLIYAFKDGANWQKQQMMNGALDGKMVDGDEPTLVIPSLPITTRHLDDGDKVKVIILKEE